MDAYLATNLLRRREATRELEILFDDANYMWEILTCASKIADHPDQELSYWRGWDGHDRQRQVELPAEAGTGSPLRRFILGQPPPTPARDSDRPLLLRAWIRSLGPAENFPSIINTATQVYLESFDSAWVAAGGGVSPSATASQAAPVWYDWQGGERCGCAFGG